MLAIALISMPGDGFECSLDTNSALRSFPALVLQCRVLVLPFDCHSPTVQHDQHLQQGLAVRLQKHRSRYEVTVCHAAVACRSSLCMHGGSLLKSSARRLPENAPAQLAATKPRNHSNHHSTKGTSTYSFSSCNGFPTLRHLGCFPLGIPRKWTNSKGSQTRTTALRVLLHPQ